MRSLHDRLCRLEGRLEGGKVAGGSLGQHELIPDEREDVETLSFSQEMNYSSNGPIPVASSPATAINQHITSEPEHESLRASHPTLRHRALPQMGHEEEDRRDECIPGSSDEEPGPTNAMGIGQAGESPEEMANASVQFYGKSSATAFFSHIQGRLYNAHTHGHQSRGPGIARRRPSANGMTDSSRSGFAEPSFRHMEDSHLPPRQIADHFLDLYWRRVHILYPYLHWPTLLRAYERLWMSSTRLQDAPELEGVGLGGPDCSPVIFYCAINAIFALGSQFSARSAKERRERARPFEQRARHLLRLDFLDQGDISLVQALLIMAHYLQCTNLPSRCWNLAGVAYRMAQGLGLHLEVNKEAAFPLAAEMRKRVWYGCVNLDV